MEERVRSLEEAEQHVRSLTARIEALEHLLSDHAQRFDTLQTALWKRAWFRVQGWPGQNDLNASKRAWRPWHFLLVLSLLLVTTPAQAGGDAQPLHFDLSGFTQLDQPVEQQSDYPFDPAGRYVTNPTGCSWDVDDHWLRTATGDYLNAGSSFVGSYCMVSDSSPNLRTVNGHTAYWSDSIHGRFGVLFWAPSSVLTGTVCYQPQGRCFPLNESASGKDTAYWSCTMATYLPADLEAYPLSNGRGILETITLTISNPTNQRVRRINGSIQVVPTGLAGAGCSMGSSFSDYPWVWRA